MKAGNGTLIKVFEWASKEAIEATHNNKEVIKLWERFSKLSDYLPIGQVPESREVFSEFEGI